MRKERVLGGKQLYRHFIRQFEEKWNNLHGHQVQKALREKVTKRIGNYHSKCQNLQPGFNNRIYHWKKGNAGNEQMERMIINTLVFGKLTSPSRGKMKANSANISEEQEKY